MQMISPVDTKEALDLYRQFNGTFTSSKYKNYTFNPVFFSDKYSKDPSTVPSVLRDVQPAIKGINYGEIINLPSDITPVINKN